MNLPINNEQESADQPADSQTEGAETETQGEGEEITLQDIKATTFTSAELDKAESAINTVMEVCSNASVTPKFNWDAENEELPEGYGIAITPVGKLVRGEGRQTTNVVISGIPMLDTLLAEKAGLNWVVSIVNKALVAQVKAALNSTLAKMPLTIMDFVTSSRASANAGFNHVAQDFIKIMKDNGFGKYLNKQMLSMLLSSQEFAASQYGDRVPVEAWEKILDMMIASCKQDGVDYSGLEHWKKTRNEAEVDQPEIDFSAFGLSDDEGEENAAPETAQDVAAQA